MNIWLKCTSVICDFKYGLHFYSHWKYNETHLGVQFRLHKLHKIKYQGEQSSLCLTSYANI